MSSVLDFSIPRATISIQNPGNERDSMNRTSLVLATIIVIAIGTVAPAQIAVFQDSFESGNLDHWIGKTPAGHQGRIVVDPFDSANHVLTFIGVNAAGDIFSAAPIPVSSP